MEKPCSYYDWEKSFKNTSEKKKNKPRELRRINSIGISADSFKSYLKSWKSKNMNKSFKKENNLRINNIKTLLKS